MAKAGRGVAGAGHRRRSARSSPAPSAPSCWCSSPRRWRTSPSSSAPRRTSRSWCSRCSRSPRCSAARKLRGFIALFLGLAIGLVGDRRPGSRGSPSASRCSPTASTSSWSPSRSSPSARPCGSPPTCGAGRWRSSRSASRGWAARTGRRSWKPWLRGTAFGFPFGALPAGGAEIPTFLSYITESKLSQAPRGVRQGRHRGRRRPGGRQQRLRRRHPRAAAGARPADHRDGGGDPAGASRATASSPDRS